jgi:hypothetical protein
LTLSSRLASQMKDALSLVTESGYHNFFINLS